MPKRFLIALILFTFGISGSVFAEMPVYTDDIPKSHVDKVKRTNCDEYKNVPENIENTDNQVKIFSQKKIMPQAKLTRKDGRFKVIENLHINDKLYFVVAQDVYKDGQIYIKKDSIAQGTVRTIQINYLGTLVPEYSAPAEFEVTRFQARDINGKTVDLYGSIYEKGHEMGFFGGYLSFASTEARIKKNKIYTIYYK